MRGLDRLGQTNLLGLVLLMGLAAAVWSSADDVSAQGGLPTRPAVHTITALHQGLRAYWYESSEDGGSVITGYDVEYRSVGTEQWTDAGHTGTSQPSVITGLRFNTSYEVRVRARNANGAGPWSSVESRRTSRDDGKPDRPWPPTLEPGDERIEVSWTAPAYTGGRPITGYHVRYTTDNAATWRTWAPGGNRRITGTTTTITGLVNGVTVGVAVGAVNARGQGLYSLPFSEAAPAPMLTLSLESSRQLCTANTLTELTWTITGGVAPYTLTIEGEEVEPDTESHRANCGPLTTDPLTGDPLLSQKRTFSAAVTDAHGVVTAGAAAVDLAPPLPALEPVPEGYSAVSSYRFGLGFKWSTGAAHRLCGIADCFAIRWRAVHSQDWAYAPMTHGLDPRTGNRPFSFVWGLSDGGMYEAAGAAMRDPIELETPGALRWTAPLRGTTLTDPTGLTATATHDTVTVRWDRQPAARHWDVLLQGPNGSLTKRTHRYRFPADASWGDPASKFHEVVFRDVPSDTRFKVLVKWSLSEGFLDARSETVVRTHTPPPGQEALPRGPQNLRATATHDSITVMWDRPFEGDSSHYVVFLFHPEYSSTGRVAYAFAPDTEVTYTGLDAEVSYRVSVIHKGIVQSRGQLIVQTKAALASSDGVSGAGGVPGIDYSLPFSEAAPAPALTLSLESSRQLCTANTLTELRWTITGGVPPYKLTVEGERVDPSAESHQVNCGSLTMDPLTEEPLPNQKRTFEATVTDSTPTPASAEGQTAVRLGEALPVVPGVEVNTHRTYVGIYWPNQTRQNIEDNEAWYLVRWRPSGESMWRYHQVSRDLDDAPTIGWHTTPQEEPPLRPIAREAAVARTRDDIEAATPDALNWSPSLIVTSVVPPSGITLTATHDSVTVRWDPQASNEVNYQISVGTRDRDPYSGASTYVWLQPDDDHQVTFSNLLPSTEYHARITVRAGFETMETPGPKVRTAEAPADYRALPIGPQNVRVTEVTSNSISVRWDRPYPGASERYSVYLFRADWPNYPVQRDRGTGYYQARFNNLDPETDYVVWVTHYGTVKQTARLPVTTRSSADSTAPGGNQLITGLDNGVAVGVTAAAINALGQGRYTSPSAETAPVPALTLSLESSRQLCTANTLTELSWTITGGVPPYTLTVEGERVDPDSEKYRANCGPIASDPLTGDPVANPTKTFQAGVMDARQFASTANEVVDLASPLHAPQNPFISGLVQTIRFGFDRVVDAGGQWPTEYEPSVDADKLDPGYVLRTRSSGTSPSASFQVRRLPAFTDEIEWSASGKHVGMIAAMRHPIEHHTPSALVWSEPVAFALARSPEQVMITATHDTATISWAEQPQAQCVNITIDGPAYRDSRFVSEVSTHAGRHSYTFVRLTPGTEYDVTIRVGCYTSDAHGPSHDIPRVAYYFGVASTTPAPPNWTAPAIGPQNRRATAIQADVFTQQGVLGASWRLPPRHPPVPFTSSGCRSERQRRGRSVAFGSAPNRSSNRPRILQ